MSKYNLNYPDKFKYQIIMLIKNDKEKSEIIKEYEIQRLIRINTELVPYVDT